MLFPPPPGIHPEKVSPPAAGIGLALRQPAGREKYRVQPTGVETVNLAVRVLLQKTGGLLSRLIDFPRSSHTGSLLRPNPIHSNGFITGTKSSFSAYAGICVML